MSTPTNWTCWAWSENDQVRYVGSGPFTDDFGHPAKRRWNARFDDESPLNIWLQGFIDEPPRSVCGLPIMSREMARSLSGIFQARYRGKLISAREHSGGGHPRRIAFVPDFDNTPEDFHIFRSVRETARWARIDPATVTRRCKNEKCGEWLYLD